MRLLATDILHYEFIEGRPEGRQWRVANEQDDVVLDFPTEDRAKVCVIEHNDRAVSKRSSSWKYS